MPTSNPFSAQQQTHTSKSFKEVAAAELVVIKKLRNINNKTSTENNNDSIDTNLVGLAFSGGGIRSATFGLGVLEALKKAGILKKVDYLSTVSGGGYIGGWLSANCRRHGHEWLEPQDPVKVQNDSDIWNDSIKHLRRYSNYLSPNLSLLSADTWSMVTIWLRNTLLLQLMIILAIAGLLLLPRFAEPLIKLMTTSWLHWLISGLFVLLIFCIAANLKTIKETEETTKTKGVKEEPDDNLLTIMNGFIIKPFPKWSFNQVQVQGLIVVSMIISLGFSALLWQHAEANRGFLAVLSELLGSYNSFQWFLVIPFFAMFVLSVCSSRNHIVSLLVAIPPTIVLFLLLSFTMYWIGDWKAEAYGQSGGFLAFAWAPPMVLAALSIAIILLIGMQGNGSYEYVREWWSRFAAWLAIYGAAWMLVVVITFYGPLWVELFYYEGWWKSMGSGWVGTVMAGLFAGKSSTTTGKSHNDPTTIAIEILAKATPFIFIAGLLFLVSTGLHLIIANINDCFTAEKASLIGAVQNTLSTKQTCGISTTVELPHYLTHWNLLAKGQTYQLNGHWAISTLLIISITCLFLLAWRLDINEFSLNAFYRNRLARCYLGATRRPSERTPHEFTGFDRNDDLKLTELLINNQTPCGPFHILNCALNLGGSSDLGMHTRHSANFTLSPLFCGSHYQVKNPNGTQINEIGYIKTADYGGHLPPTLGQAISVSGAAASPNMGYHTSAPTAFLMTLFNARLGWWFPNPFKSDCKSPSPRNSLLFILHELFGIADENSDFLAISDGGHFENLAAYELVKRKCKVIIISDGECDPKIQCEGLANLIRICQIDFGATITIDISKIKPKKASVQVTSDYTINPSDDFDWSENRCAIGTITYKADDEGNAQLGHLVYIKASMKGNKGKGDKESAEDEGTAIMQYKETHPDFPHEATSNQFYAEDQFESYRCLGKAITAEALASIKEESKEKTGHEKEQYAELRKLLKLS